MTQDIELIAICAPMKAGKDTAAAFMKEELTGLANLPLAGFLKYACAEVFDIRKEDFENQEFKATPFETPKIVSFIELMQLARLYSDKLGRRKIYFEILCAHRDFDGKVIETPRQLLQWVGTDFLRTAMPDIHLDVAELSMVPGKKYIVTDCRFENEVNWIQRRGGKVFYIERPEAEERMFESTHSSEKGIAELRFKCDYLIQNRGSLEEFKINISEALKVIQGQSS